ncbi:tRNA (N6-threonylcarbamoyladenosine(37)-N6)-methyltransferase TrmO [Candidatus Thiothrix sp. Deng01]|uniref:tRNA (N6-threonylcarbamoyladenosine(37)-N6)-methyltransferase TrmO n=1 Tax=Candidatus Thiothrix phosphatis TaxID=3112415 RepID=A0ABU6D281_9GAMM|nr:tRNA (N6-threonylcarbamoyladenosine(37)-N6)-methyltransferase TrmO [Candidatus Thiothrix sp. Deng01]MEB4593172.1 tRNA (N6-threonylcarbamoyladenosine(37)-N6)-methyltransferase TrmO [Candidatus Thiothrix sp. Deng01]
MSDLANIFHPIGIIRTPFADKPDAPIQGAYAEAVEGWVELDARYEQGLQDISGFSHLILLYQFHRAGKVELVRQPFLDDVPRGLFSTRHPARPNPLGLTVVELLAREGNVLHVRGVDMLDGTPLLDIKPYVKRFDCFPQASEGWFADKSARAKPLGLE